MNKLIKLNPSITSGKVIVDEATFLSYGARSVGRACLDSAGILYLSDSSAHAIYTVDQMGRVALFAGRPGEPGSNGGSLKEARFNAPSGVAVDQSGCVYVADSENHQIRVIRNNHVYVAVGSTEGYQDGLSYQAKLSRPTDVFVNKSGVIYIADTGNHSIRQLKGLYVTTLAGDGTAGDVLGLSSRLRGPLGVTADTSGWVYVSDTGNRKVKIINPGNGDVYHFCGSGLEGDALGDSNSTEFRELREICVDSSGTLYVLSRKVDIGIGRVVRINGNGLSYALSNIDIDDMDIVNGIAIAENDAVYVTISDDVGLASSADTSTQSSHSSSSVSSHSSSSISSYSSKSSSSMSSSESSVSSLSTASISSVNSSSSSESSSSESSPSTTSESSPSTASESSQTSQSSTSTRQTNTDSSKSEGSRASESSSYSSRSTPALSSRSSLNSISSDTSSENSTSSKSSSLNSSSSQSSKSTSSQSITQWSESSMSESSKSDTSRSTSSSSGGSSESSSESSSSQSTSSMITKSTSSSESSSSESSTSSESSVNSSSSSDSSTSQSTDSSSSDSSTSQSTDSSSASLVTSVSSQTSESSSTSSDAGHLIARLYYYDEGEMQHKIAGTFLSDENNGTGNGIVFTFTNATFTAAEITQIEFLTPRPIPANNPSGISVTLRNSVSNVVYPDVVYVPWGEPYPDWWTILNSNTGSIRLVSITINV